MAHSRRQGRTPPRPSSPPLAAARSAKGRRLRGTLGLLLPPAQDGLRIARVNPCVHLALRRRKSFGWSYVLPMKLVNGAKSSDVDRWRSFEARRAEIKLCESLTAAASPTPPIRLILGFVVQATLRRRFLTPPRKSSYTFFSCLPDCQIEVDLIAAASAGLGGSSVGRQANKGLPPQP